MLNNLFDGFSFSFDAQVNFVNLVTFFLFSSKKFFFGLTPPTSIQIKIKNNY